MGKGQIQLLPCLEPSYSFHVNLRKKIMQLNEKGGERRRRSLIIWAFPSFIFHFSPSTLFSLPAVFYLHQLLCLLFPVSAKIPQALLESLLCTAVLPWAWPSETYPAACCNGWVCLLAQSVNTLGRGLCFILCCLLRTWHGSITIWWAMMKG